MMPFRAIGPIAFCLAALVAAGGHAASLSSPVKVEGGVIVGERVGALDSYLGIPFAAPPVGELRWRAPQAVVPWQGVREARSFASACAQSVTWVAHPKSEDCLYLNVWAPRHARKLPVIVWIHGGGLAGGSAAQRGFNGANLARRGAVVVSLNYRLGIFGFFAHPELTAQSPDHASGNQGILDQIAALRWVRNNIAAFGGDPERVAIAGESAGGTSVGVLVASPLAKGLFQRAIAESGNYSVPINENEMAQANRQAAEAEGRDFATAMGAKNLADLRTMSVADLHRREWEPRIIVEDHLLREDLTTTYRHHRQNDVPLLVGWNAEEGRDLAPAILGTGEFTAARHGEQVAKLMLGHTPSAALLAAYPGATDAEARASMIQLTTDWWGWRMVHWAALQAKYGRSPAYAYFFAHRPAAPLTPCGYGCGAGHGAEIRYLFDNLDQDARPWSASDRQLAARLATTWVNFARSGSPVGEGLPAWPRYDGSAASVARIGDEAELKEFQLPDFSLFPQLVE